MTLSTHVYLLTEANPKDVFFECRRLLGATTETWKNREVGWAGYGENVWEFGNDCGQGLPALLDVRYRPDGMVQAENDVHEDWCDEDCTYPHAPAHWVLVDFDTAYSYTDSHGGCGTLHARLLFDLGGWLDQRGIRWAWRNEFTSEVHVGDKYEHLKDLVDGGQPALRWLKETVEPVIASMGGRLVR